jgi:hypothetical protein
MRQSLMRQQELDARLAGFANVLFATGDRGQAQQDEDDSNQFHGDSVRVNRG